MFDWRNHKLDFGMYEGETMYSILVHDFSYIQWLDCNQLDKKTRKAVNAAIKYYEEFFPEA